MRAPVAMTAIACIMLTAGCNGRPLLYQIAPSETDQETLAAFEKIDTAHAGRLTRQEVDAYFTQRFQALDRNHDGFLDAEEVRGAVPILGMQSGSSMMFRLDMNGDGRLSLPEFLALSNYLFVRDENRDGVLTLTEVKTPPVEGYVPVGKQGPSFDNPAATRTQ